jgi:hypothetical protein
MDALLGFIGPEKSASKPRTDTTYSVKLSFPCCKTAAVSILWFDVRSEDKNKINRLHSSEHSCNATLSDKSRLDHRHNNNNNNNNSNK